MISIIAKGIAFVTDEAWGLSGCPKQKNMQCVMINIFILVAFATHISHTSYAVDQKNMIYIIDCQFAEQNRNFDIYLNNVLLVS